MAILFVTAGAARLKIEPRITGGFDPKVNAIPSFVALSIEFERGETYCGGLLSALDRVITSASCVYE